MLLDRSGQGKVYQLINRRRFQQMEVIISCIGYVHHIYNIKGIINELFTNIIIQVLEGQNILVTISGKKNRVRVYYLSWLKGKILRTEGAEGERRNGYINVGELQVYIHTIFAWV